ncbi:MAG: histidinol-phosphate transaminase [Omnitrophica WOR_2 bacterium GWC2_45_7]|nr:MAG: histidinol-phosphate transaminase [Omnitrophica WOR_2 bacterium GWC2_45_7]
MRHVVKKTILDVKPYVPGKPIEEVKRELALKNVIKLASNENPYGPSPKAFEAIQENVRSLNRYPDGDCFYLRRELARRLGVKPRQLIFGNGSDELIVMAVRAFVNDGDEVVMAQPSFLIYEIASRVAGADIQGIPLKDFCYDLPAMKRAVGPKTKIVFLGNPDNPAGRYITQSQMADFLQGIREDVLVFIDEAYFEYVDAPDYVDSIRLIPRHKNIIVARTFSKMYGLAGLRVGDGIADEALVDLLNRIREPFNVNSLAQAAALACLKDQAYYRKIARRVKAQREFLYLNLRKLGLSLIETHTNFILINVGQDATGVSDRLMKKGIIVRDMSSWGLRHFIRVTIGTETENKKFISVLRNIL